MTRTLRSTPGPGPAAVRSGDDAPGFGREPALPRERTTIDAFTGSMEAMEVDQEMIDLRAEVDRLRGRRRRTRRARMTNTRRRQETPRGEGK